jgi:trk system potassium uptake protein TrkH
MTLFDAVCHSFATVATGGFSTKNASIAHFNSAYIDGVITVFMFVAAVRFPLHYAALRGNFGRYRRDDEFRFFVWSFLAGLFFVLLVLLQQSDIGFLQAFRLASFNVISIMSSTGFATADFALWAPLGQVVLLLLMFPGACAGSTGGGIKNVRVLLLLKIAVNEFKQLIHPSAVVPIRYNGKVVGNEVLFTIAGFIILFLISYATATVLVVATGVDLITSISAVASSMSNIGPGLGTVGPMSNYSHLPEVTKWILAACMVIGRLEIYTVFVLFSKAFWRS